MPKLSILDKNAYLDILVKNNGIWVYLAYSDLNAGREYILSDYTDLNALRFLLDDNVFTKEFWFDYFDNLEKVFNWDIVDRDKGSIFTFRNFTQEGDGISGVRVQIDDNQQFFTKVFDSVRDFSSDISLRVIDDNYMYSILDGLCDRMGCDDMMYVDMDTYDFSIFRVSRQYDKERPLDQKLYTKSKMSWKDDISLIDSLKDQRFRAFLSAEISEKNLVNMWGNFVLDKPLSIMDPQLLDVIRGYATIQNFSIYRDNKKKIETFGKEYTNSVMIVSGSIPRILGKSKTLLTLIDGLELGGNFDCYFDSDSRLLAYGKSFISGVNSTDIILTRKTVLPPMTKVYIPYVKTKQQEKVILSGTVESLTIPREDFYALSSQYTYKELPKHRDKLVINGSFKNGAKQQPLGETEINLVSIPGVNEVEALLFDCRIRPIIYGPDAYANKIKLQSWINDN